MFTINILAPDIIAFKYYVAREHNIRHSTRFNGIIFRLLTVWRSHGYFKHRIPCDDSCATGAETQSHISRLTWPIVTRIQLSAYILFIYMT